MSIHSQSSTDRCLPPALAVKKLELEVKKLELEIAQFELAQDELETRSRVGSTSTPSEQDHTEKVLPTGDPEANGNSHEDWTPSVSPSPA